MPERTDTTGIELKPKGKYVLEIERVIKSQIGREGGKQYPGYKWYFIVRFCDVDIDFDNFNMFMFKSQMAEILRAIDAKEVSDGIFEWELNDAEGKMIECHMAHVDINGKLRDQLIEVKSFKENIHEKTVNADDVAWDE